MNVHMYHSHTHTHKISVGLCSHVAMFPSTEIDEFIDLSLYPSIYVVIHLSVYIYAYQYMEQ